MSKKNEATLLLVGGLVVGAMAQQVVKHEAALLGLSGLELLFLGMFVAALVKRTTG